MVLQYVDSNLSVIWLHNVISSRFFFILTKSGLSVYLSSKSASVYKVAFDHDQYKNSHRSWLKNIMQYHQFGVCIKGEGEGG